MPFLPPNQQRQSTEGNKYSILNICRGLRGVVRRGELSASVIENAEVRTGAMLRASRRRAWGRRPTIVLGRDGQTLRCTESMMGRADAVGARCRAVVRCRHGGRWTRVGRRRYRCRSSHTF